MSDFITTMTARAMGEIPTVEPLLYSMYLKLPMIPGDYTEDRLSESEPSEFIDNEPGLNFKPLVTSKGFSATMPRWDANSDLQFDSVTSVEIDPQYDVTSDSGINTETENTFNENSQEVKDNIFQPVTEISEYPIAPQINRLEATSQSVEANVEFDSNTSISDSESQLHSDDIQSPISRQSNNTEDREIISKEIPKGDNKEPAVNSSNLNSEAGVLPNILPQVNHLETASQSVEANVELDLTTSTNQSQSEENFNNIDKPLREQLTNTQNLPTQKASEIDKLETRSVQNSSTNDTRNQQTQIDAVNQKKIIEKTVIPKLINDSQLTNQVKPSLKKRTLLPQVNRVETAKSVKPDIQLDATQYNLQSPSQQQRSIHQGEKTQTEELSPSQSNNNSPSQTPASSQQQSIEPNLYLRSNLVNQHLITDNEITVIATIGSNPKPSENRNEFISPINDKHRNTEFVEKAKTQSSIFRVTPNLSEQKSVIPPGEDYVSLLPSPIVKTSSPIHTQAATRRNQAEPQPSTTIQVNIGRIEVRGVQPEPSPKSQGRKSTKKSPALSLSDYLTQRNGN